MKVSCLLAPARVYKKKRLDTLRASGSSLAIFSRPIQVPTYLPTYLLGSKLAHTVIVGYLVRMESGRCLYGVMCSES